MLGGWTVLRLLDVDRGNMVMRPLMGAGAGRSVPLVTVDGPRRHNAVIRDNSEPAHDRLLSHPHHPPINPIIMQTPPSQSTAGPSATRLNLTSPPPSSSSRLKNPLTANSSARSLNTSSPSPNSPRQSGPFRAPSSSHSRPAALLMKQT